MPATNGDNPPTSPVQKVRRIWPIVFALVLIFLIRFGSGILYSRVVPAWESYDEPWHFAYAIQIATTGTLPQDSDPIPNNERIQPPAYYFVLAAFLKLSGSDVSAFQYPDRNPYFFYGTSGLNYALHPQTLTAGEQQVENALEASRWLSLLLSLLGVAFTYRAARLIWPNTPGLTLAATTIFALWPQGLFNSSVISNDGPAMVWGALLTWGILRLAQGRRTPGLAIKVGILCVIGIGLGLLVKINLLAFVLPLIFVVLASASVRLIGVLGALGVVVLATALVALQRLPSVLLPFFAAQPTSTIRVLLTHLQQPGSFVFILHTLQYAVDSMFGLFGWGNVPLPTWLQTAWMIAAGIGLIGAVWLIASGRWIKRRLDTPTTRHWITIGSVLLTLIAGAVALAVNYESIHLVPGRYLLPGLAAFCLLIVAGWSSLPGRLLRRIVIGVSVGGLALLAAFIPVFIVAPVYSHPPFVADADVPNQMSAELTPGIVLIGYDIPQAVVYPGDSVAIDLYFKAMFPLLTDYTVHIDVIGPDGQGYGTLDSFPGNGNYPTSMWAVKQPFRDRYSVPIRSDFPAPALAHFRISLLPADARYAPVDFGAQAIHARTAPTPVLARSQAAEFGPGLLLRGAALQLNEPTAAPRTLTVDLTWEATAHLPDRTVFVHLQNDQTRAVVAQLDQPPRAGTFPLSWWLPGELVADRYVVTLPSGLPEAHYPLRVGLYDPSGGERWTGTLPGNIPAGIDGVLLAYLDVDAQGRLMLDPRYPGLDLSKS